MATLDTGKIPRAAGAKVLKTIKPPKFFINHFSFFVKFVILFSNETDSDIYK
jgi:hypothetical protein